MGFKNAKQMVNAITKGALTEGLIKAEKKKAEVLLKRLQVYAKTQTKQQIMKMNQIQRKYYDAVEGAESALRLTKAQLMVQAMEKQIEIYEKH